MSDKKNALRLPKPIEIAWTVLFGLINAVPTFVFSTLSVCLTLPLLAWWNMKMAVKLNCISADWTWWWMAMAFEKWGRSKCRYYGDKIPMRENAFLSSNHMTFLDWAF